MRLLLHACLLLVCLPLPLQLPRPQRHACAHSPAPPLASSVPLLAGLPDQPGPRRRKLRPVLAQEVAFVWCQHFQLQPFQSSQPILLVHAPAPAAAAEVVSVPGLDTGPSAVELAVQQR